MVPIKSSTGAETRLIWLLGHPVSHSFSPRIHNAAFRYQGLDYRYEAHDVLPERLSAALVEMRRVGVRGANLTLPLKELVPPLLDVVDPQAAAIGAVNTIVNDEGRLYGHNTDVDGFTSALRTILPAGARGLDCLVVGAGGAARAAVAALLSDQPKRVMVANRTSERAVHLCASIPVEVQSPCLALSLEQAAILAGEVDLVVNATSIGLADSVKDFPLDVDSFHSGQVLFDLVYGLVTTSLVQRARMRGALAVDGREMLLQQAARSYELWTGQKAPLEVMRESITSFEG